MNDWICSTSGQKDSSVCVAPDAGRLCLYDSECPSGTRCLADQLCHAECLAAVDCERVHPGSVCTEAGVCDRAVNVVFDGGVAPDASDVVDVPMDIPPPCPTGQQRCDSTCVDLSSDFLNCGTCLRRCVANQACVSGECVAVQATQLVAGENHFCAMLNDRSVRCWGDNTQAQLGLGDMAVHDGPVSVTLPDAPLQLTAGDAHTCALLSNNRVYCWGRNAEAQIAFPATPVVTTPAQVMVPISAGDSILRLASGGKHMVVLTQAGRVFTWGDNLYGETGVPPATQNTQIRVAMRTTASNAGYQDIFAGTHVSCGKLATGDAECWGDLLGTNASSVVPVRVMGLTAVSQLSMLHLYHRCALHTDATVSCWGSNSSGALGDNTTQDRFTVGPVMNLTGATGIAVGGVHSCARTAGGVVCWGSGTAGQLGTGTSPARPVTLPVPVLTLTETRALAASSATTCAIRGDGSVACWGDNHKGELGQERALYTQTSLPISMVF